MCDCDGDIIREYVGDNVHQRNVQRCNEAAALVGSMKEDA